MILTIVKPTLNMPGVISLITGDNSVTRLPEKAMFLSRLLGLLA